MKLKRAGLVTKIVVFVLIAYTAVSLISLRAKIESAKSSQLTLRQQVRALEVQNAERRYNLEHAGDDETIADIARGELGLVAPGEKVFYDTDN